MVYDVDRKEIPFVIETKHTKCFVIEMGGGDRYRRADAYFSEGVLTVVWHPEVYFYKTKNPLDMLLMWEKGEV